MRDRLIKLEEIDSISIHTVKEYYLNHVNTGIPKILSMLCFDKLEVAYAEGIYIYTKDGQKIHDFTGGFSVLNLGHNHPRILKARQAFNEKKSMEIWKTFLSPYLAVLSKNLAAISPGDLNYAFFCNSGAEANEGALKLAEKYQSAEKKKIIYTDISFHGKTHATMSVSGSETSRKHFKLLDDCVSIPYGDDDAFEHLIKSCSKGRSGGNDIIAIIVEAIHGEGVIIPPKGYLKRIRKLCDEHNILMIIDEIFCGLGRTGKMFSFEYEEIIPDIFTIAKSLGGGKASIGAYITKDHIYKAAYGSLKDSMIHTTTFNGLGEECYTAIEAVNILVEEGLVENSAKMGDYFLSRLNTLKHKHHDIIKDARGTGLLLCVELRQPASEIVNSLGDISSFANQFMDGFLSGIVLSLLMHKHNILVFPGPNDKSSLMIIPPLIVEKEHVDYFIDSLDDLLSMGILNMVKAYSRLKIKHMIS